MYTNFLRNFKKYYLCSGFGKWDSSVSTPVFDFSLWWMGVTLSMCVFCLWKLTPREPEASLPELSESWGVTSAIELPILELLLWLWPESTETNSTSNKSSNNEETKKTAAPPHMYILSTCVSFYRAQQSEEATEKNEHQFVSSFEHMESNKYTWISAIISSDLYWWTVPWWPFWNQVCVVYDMLGQPCI